MKYVKILRIFSIAFILSLLVVALPATAQTRFITLFPTEGSIGDTITIAGEGFNKSTDTTDKYANIYFSSDEASMVHDIDDEVTHYKTLREGVWLDELGEFTTTFKVPAVLDDGATVEDVEVGTTYYVYVTHYPYTRIRAVAQFTVTGGEITLDLTSGPVGIEVEITGIDFSANKDITIKYDSGEINIEAGDTQTSSDGGFTSFILIPDSITGVHTITVVISGSEVGADFTVEPEIILAPTSGEANTTVTVSGTGFGRRQEIIVYFNSVGLATTITDGLGSFSTTFSVLELEAGIYDVEAEDADANLVTAKFTITAPPPPSPPPTPPPAPSPPPSPTAVNMNPTSGYIGADLAISGAGFEAGGTITIKYDDETIATVAADSNGIFVFISKVPVSKHGNHTITVSDGTNTEKLTFTVESVAPPVPEPLLPEMGAEVEPPISFDWKNVTDSSPPVTYALQIATSQDFSAASIVLDKQGLTVSLYSVTEEEASKLVGQEAPYYWRIRAIDGASNEGEWTGAGQFYIAPPFSLPSWALYTLIGLGGLALFALGYWVGKRTAYYY